MVPLPLSVPLCTLPPGPGPPRFVCYCEEEAKGAGGPGGFSLYVTDAAELWSTRFTPDSLAALVENSVGPECGGGHHSPVQEVGASLALSGGPSALEFELSKVPGPEAASRLQALTLGLAERVCSLERQLAAVEERAASPRKSPRRVGPQQFLPDPDSQRGCPGPGVRRRCPGESLINPGFKSKKPEATRLSPPAQLCKAGPGLPRAGTCPPHGATPLADPNPAWPRVPHTTHTVGTSGDGGSGLPPGVGPRNVGHPAHWQGALRCPG
ncbi:protein PAXX isoform 3-T3 [Molossus nigricans]